MDNLEPYPGFYDENRYGDNEKFLIHYATVSMLYIWIYNSKVIFLTNLILII